MIARVVFNLPLDRSFDYAVPQELSDRIRPGVRVAVPFGRRQMIGFVSESAEKSEWAELKPVRRVIDPWPVISADRWDLARWLERRYACSLGEALAAMVPQGLRLKPDAAAPSLAADASALEKPPALTAHQARAWAAIRGALAKGSSLLLHGITSSGKTELYLRGVAEVLEEGRSAICLIPEISLTPQTLERFRARFGADRVILWHSRLKARQRGIAWLAAASDQRPHVIVGPRSAVFAPVRRLGLIVIDEEHEATYKQEDVPRYHARDVAEARARLAGAAVILGSATPAIETYYRAEQGTLERVTLPERIHERPLPQVDIVDMRGEAGGRRGVFSVPLRMRLEQALSRNDQVMLLLNRRGFARTALCTSCGWMAQCPACSIPMIYHADRKQLICHHCNKEQAVPDDCPACGKGYLRMRGSGTQKIESELHRFFPAASVARMDSDSMSDPASHDSLYSAFKNRDIGLLVGTQMIAKGLDFPAVTLVGIVSADTSLHLPDFRAGERTFTLLTQVAGRAGRGESPGRVILQTHHPEHPAIQAAAKHDYTGFYAQEIVERRRLGLPPFRHLVELTVLGRQHKRVEEAAAALADGLAKQLDPSMELLGPAPHRIPKLRGTYRVCLLVKGPAPEALVQTIQRCLEPGRKFQGLPVGVDVDP